MPTFEVHYEQNKQTHIELMEAESAEGAWKEFVARSREEGTQGKDRQVVCVIRHEID